jgi:hypothetical protein
MTSSANGCNRRIAALLLAVIILSLANLAMTFWILRQDGPPMPPSPTAPYCQAIPTRLILEDPECADKLLRVMNVTRVRIMSGRAGVMSAEEPG